MTDRVTIPELTRRTYAMVLAGGRGSRLKELTNERAKPAVHFGAKNRIIDFVLSNVWNSGIRKMGLATQYKAHSLIRHCQRGWRNANPITSRSLGITCSSLIWPKWLMLPQECAHTRTSVITSNHICPKSPV